MKRQDVVSYCTSVDKNFPVLFYDSPGSVGLLQIVESYGKEVR